jgi:hypothetical protein
MEGLFKMAVYAKRILVEREPIRGNPNDQGILNEGCSDKCFYLRREKVGTFTNFQCSLYRMELSTKEGAPLALSVCIREFCVYQVVGD